jgi:hypothetical protein
MRRYVHSRDDSSCFNSSCVQYGFPEASYRTVTTLTFIAPAVVLPRIMEQLNADLSPADLRSLTDFDYGVWQTPEGTTFVDGQEPPLSQTYSLILNVPSQSS